MQAKLQQQEQDLSAAQNQIEQLRDHVGVLKYLLAAENKPIHPEVRTVDMAGNARPHECLAKCGSGLMCVFIKALVVIPACVCARACIRTHAASCVSDPVWKRI